MASKTYYTTMAVPAAEVPKDFLSSGTFPKGDELLTGSRKDWLRGAISTCLEHFHCADLSHLLEEKAVVAPSGVRLATESLGKLLQDIDRAPDVVVELLEQDGWSEEELRTVVREPADWFSVYDRWEDQEGDSIPYLLSVLKAHHAVLLHAEINGLWILHRCWL